MNLHLLKYRTKRWLKRAFAPPRYYLATYGDMGLEVQFFRDGAAYDDAVEQADMLHRIDDIDSYEHGDID